MGFGDLDKVILCLYLVGVTLFGYLARGRVASTRDYFLAGRRAPWWLACVSIVATETSTLTFVALPGIAFAGDLSFLQVVFGFLLGRVAVALFLVPAYARGRLSTSYELLSRRLGAVPQRAAAGVFCLTRLLGDGVRLFSACVVLEEILDRTLGAAPGNDLLAVVVIGLLTLVYTVTGGMRSVLWTDFVQLLLYLAGGGLALHLALKGIPGGLAGLWEAAGAAGKLDFLKFAPDSFFGGLSLYSGLLGGALLSMATHGTDQLIVQRLLACRSRRAARAAMVGSGVLVLLQMAFFLLVGLALWGFYEARGTAGLIEQKEVFARFLVRELPSGVSGLIVAAAFAAAMSTLSSSLNSLAATTVNDFYLPLTGGTKGEAHYLAAGRLATLLWGLALMGVALPAREIDELLQAGLSIAAITAGGVLGLFLLSPLKPRGATGGMFLAIALCALFWADGMAGWGLLPALHWTWLTPLGLVVSLATGGLFLAVGRRR